MSTCRLSCPYVGAIDVRVTGFRSPLSGDIRTSQTKLARHSFPIKATQQNLQLDVIFRNWEAYRAMQDFARKHQLRSLGTVEQPEITIYWPERNIDNWSGVLLDFRAGQDRYVPSPKASLNFLLVDSMLSDKTWTASFGEDFEKFFESDIGDPLLIPPPLPTRPGTGTGPGQSTNVPLPGNTPNPGTRPNPAPGTPPRPFGF